MKIIKVLEHNQSAIIKQAAQVIKHGGVVVYPTETAYGLGADFFNPKAIKKVYQIKGRSFKKQLTAIVSSLAMAKKLVRFNALSLMLAKKHWPGPLTLVITRSDPSAIASGQAPQSRNWRLLHPPIRRVRNDTLGLRISSNKLANAMVKKLNRPLTATSANLSGRGEFYSVSEIIKQFKNRKYKPDLIIDAGRLPKRKPSTIVKVADGQIKVLRQGSIVIASDRRERGDLLAHKRMEIAASPSLRLAPRNDKLI